MYIICDDTSSNSKHSEGITYYISGAIDFLINLEIAADYS